MDVKRVGNPDAVVPYCPLLGHVHSQRFVGAFGIIFRLSNPELSCNAFGLINHLIVIDH